MRGDFKKAIDHYTNSLKKMQTDEGKLSLDCLTTLTRLGNIHTI